jgi:putative flippase GtrA
MSVALLRAVRGSAGRFLVVGLLSFVADAGLLYLFHGVLGLWLPLATAMAFLGAFVVNFSLNRTWAFRSDGAVGRQFWRYLALVLANLIATVALVSGFTALGLPYLVAKAATTATLVAINYAVSRRWIFLKDPTPAGRPSNNPPPQSAGPASGLRV